MKVLRTGAVLAPTVGTPGQGGTAPTPLTDKSCRLTITLNPIFRSLPRSAGLSKDAECEDSVKKEPLLDLKFTGFTM